MQVYDYFKKIAIQNKRKNELPKGKTSMNAPIVSDLYITINALKT